ncbi:MAG: formylglycine-generating enzyme family protein [Treponema sp.]
MRKLFYRTRCISFLLVFFLMFAFIACKQNQGATTNTHGSQENPDNPVNQVKKELDFNVGDGIKFKMLLIPGCKAQRIGIEKSSIAPLRFITLSPFYMAETEVTQELYQKVMGKNPSNFTDSSLEEGEVQTKRPVETVSWLDAVEFCNKLTELVFRKEECVYDIGGGPAAKDGVGIIRDKDGKITRKGFRLPTESEWEWASRGGVYQTPQYIGPVLPAEDFDDLGEPGTEAYNKKSLELAKKCKKLIHNYGWLVDKAGGKTHQVKLKKPNGYKLYDMAGNVSEWCWDTYFVNIADDYKYPDYIRLEQPVPEDIVLVDYFGPTLPSPNSAVLLKGGSFFYPPVPKNAADSFIIHASCDYRFGTSSNSTANWLGFRMVCGEIKGK